MATNKMTLLERLVPPNLLFLLTIPQGVNVSTLSQWLRGKVKGYQAKVEETISHWLKNLYAHKPKYMNKKSEDLRK